MYLTTRQAWCAAFPHRAFRWTSIDARPGGRAVGNRRQQRPRHLLSTMNSLSIDELRNPSPNATESHYSHWRRRYERILGVGLAVQRRNPHRCGQCCFTHLRPRGCLSANRGDCRLRRISVGGGTHCRQFQAAQRLLIPKGCSQLWLPPPIRVVTFCNPTNTRNSLPNRSPRPSPATARTTRADPRTHLLARTPRQDKRSPASTNRLSAQGARSPRDCRHFVCKMVFVVARRPSPGDIHRTLDRDLRTIGVSADGTNCEGVHRRSRPSQSQDSLPTAGVARNSTQRWE